MINANNPENSTKESTQKNPSIKIMGSTKIFFQEIFWAIRNFAKITKKPRLTLETHKNAQTK